MTKTRKTQIRTIVMLMIIFFSNLLLILNLANLNSNESSILNDVVKNDEDINLLEEKDKTEVINKENPQSSDLSKEIEIITPENKSYSGPMEGYYPSTYGFECDELGNAESNLKALPGYDWSYTIDSGNSIDVIAEEEGHKNVLKFETTGATGQHARIISYWPEEKENGTIEFYFKLMAYKGRAVMEAQGDAGAGPNIRVGDSNDWLFYVGSSPNYMQKASGGQMDDPVLDHWYHIRMAYETRVGGGYEGLGQYKFKVWIDGVESEVMDFRYDSVQKLFWCDHWDVEYESYISYIDALSYSWEDGYKVGEILEEGLLVKSTNSTNLNITHYSLDGQEKIYICGNTTIPMPTDGTHNIQVFGNDSKGNDYYSDIRYFSVNHIEIITPEKKTYTEPIAGYYPGSKGFEDDKNNEYPSGWYLNGQGSGYTGYVLQEKANHKKVFQVYDGAGGRRTFVRYYWEHGSQNSGTVEFWMYYENGNDYQDHFGVMSNGAYQATLEVRSGTIWYHDGVAGPIDSGFSFSKNTWYRFEIDFSNDGTYKSLAVNTFEFRIYDDHNELLFTSPEDIDYEGALGQAMTAFYCNTGDSATSYVYFDAIGFSFDPYYDLGDNIQEGLLIGYKNSTNLNITDYSLNGQSKVPICGNTTIPMPSDGSYNIQVFGNDSKGTYYSSDLKEFSVYHIGIISPENKTYTEPMEGYYPGTFGFENDINGRKPFDWILDETGGSGYIISNRRGHKKVLEINDTSNSASVKIENQFSITKNGTIEFWFITNNSNQWHSIGIYDGPQATGILAIYLRVQGGDLSYNDGSQWSNLRQIQENIWYHIRIDLESSSGKYQNLIADTFDIYLNGISIGSSLSFYTEVTQIESFYMQTENNGLDYSFCLDAIGYSWEKNYEIGDNLQEGLLLGCTNSTNLNITHYSIDSQEKVRIYGNNTIRPSDGTHNIQVFGNDSKGNQYASELKYFTSNLLAPQFEGPQSGSKFLQSSSDNYLKWNITEIYNGNYTIRRNGTKEANANFNHHENVSIEVNTTTVGFWNYTIIAEDSAHHKASHTVIIEIYAIEEPEPEPETPVPVITSLNDDFAILQGNTGSFSWKIIADNPDEYKIYLNDTLIKTAEYENDTLISYTVDNWTINDYVFKIVAYNEEGNSASDEIIVSIIERTDESIFIKPGVIHKLDLTEQAGIYIELKTSGPGVLNVSRKTSIYGNIENIWGNLSSFYFYSIKLYDQQGNEDDAIIESMIIRFFYDTEEVSNTNQLCVLHYIYNSRRVWIWKAEEVTINTEENYVEMSTTKLSVFCLAEMNADTSFGLMAFLGENFLIIIILAAIGISIPSSAYVYRSRSKKKGRESVVSEKDKFFKGDDKKLEEFDFDHEDIKERARKKREQLEKRTWTSEQEEPENQRKSLPSVKAKNSTKEQQKTPKISPIKPKKKKVKKEKAIPKEKAEEQQKKRTEEIEKTESEMDIEEEIERCTVHKGPITGMVYICPKCRTKYCQNCAKALKARKEGCWVCDTPIQLEAAEEQTDIEEISLNEQDLMEITEQDEKFHENLILNASNIAKIWLFDSKSGEEIYEETMIQEFLNSTDYDKILPQILKNTFEKDKFIEKAFKIKNKQVYCLVYFSSYFVNSIIISADRLNMNYFNQLREAIEEIEENYLELKDSKIKLRKILDSNAYIYLSRKYAMIPKEMDGMLDQIFDNPREMEEIRSEVKKMPEGTFTEFLELYGRLSEELKQISEKREMNEEKELLD